jgi:SAM-dependent methyltransferase
MKLLDNAALEHSSVVANCRMNRERVAVGGNSYSEELRFNPLSFLIERLNVAGSASWLDLCCGRGRALIETARHFAGFTGTLILHGVDLVDFFDEVPSGLETLQLEAASLHQWTPIRKYDLVTCVHGLHYVGDKLGLIERAVTWLTADGVFLASLDLANLRLRDGKPLTRPISRRFRECGLTYHHRRHVLSCAGRKSLSLGFQFLGANDAAGPNYSGQAAVDSYYDTIGCSLGQLQ